MPGIPPILGAGIGPQHEELIRRAARQTPGEEARNLGLELDPLPSMQEGPGHKIYSTPRPGADLPFLIPPTIPWNPPWKDNIPKDFHPGNPFRPNAPAPPPPFGAG